MSRPQYAHSAESDEAAEDVRDVESDGAGGETARVGWRSSCEAAAELGGEAGPKVPFGFMR